jgi:hypothetical protein
MSTEREVIDSTSDNALIFIGNCAINHAIQRLIDAADHV